MCYQIGKALLAVLIVLAASCAPQTKLGTADHSDRSYLHYLLAAEAEIEQDWDKAIKAFKESEKLVIMFPGRNTNPSAIYIPYRPPLFSGGSS